MTNLEFLSTLPAILAILGFVVYLLLRGRLPGDKILSEVVGKLRNQLATNLDKFKKLTPAQLEERIATDQKLQQQVSKQDFQLLQLVLRQQQQRSFIIYGVVVVLFMTGVGLFAYTQSQKLKIAHIGIEDGDSEAQGLLVDLDPLVVKWSSSGEPEDVTIFLENPRNGAKTQGVRTSSSEGRTIFKPDSYKDLLVARKPGEFNPFRVIVQTKQSAFVSLESQVSVGISVAIIRTERNMVRVAPLIDNSQIPSYSFQGKLLLQKRGMLDFVTFGDDMRYGDMKFKIDNPESIDWNAVKLAYFGPNDPRLVRIVKYIDTEVK